MGSVNLFKFLMSLRKKPLQSRVSAVSGRLPGFPLTVLSRKTRVANGKRDTKDEGLVGRERGEYKRAI